jgi:hypothetical protein
VTTPSARPVPPRPVHPPDHDARRSAAADGAGVGAGVLYGASADGAIRAWDVESLREKVCGTWSR